MRSKTGRSLKKFLSLLLTLSMVLGMLPTFALAAGDGEETIGNLDFTVSLGADTLVTAGSAVTVDAGVFIKPTAPINTTDPITITLGTHEYEITEINTDGKSYYNGSPGEVLTGAPVGSAPGGVYENGYIFVYCPAYASALAGNTVTMGYTIAQGSTTQSGTVSYTVPAADTLITDGALRGAVNYDLRPTPVGKSVNVNATVTLYTIKEVAATSTFAIKVGATSTKIENVESDPANGRNKNGWYGSDPCRVIAPPNPGTAPVYDESVVRWHYSNPYDVGMKNRGYFEFDSVLDNLYAGDNVVDYTIDQTGGYYTSNHGSFTVHVPTCSLTAPASVQAGKDVTLVYQSEVKDGTVVFTYNNESSSPVTVNPVTGTATYTIDGAKVVSDCAVAYAVQTTAADVKSVSADAVLNFVDDSHDVTFYDGSTVYEVQDVANGGYAVRPTNPVKAGYEFVDWYADDAYANKFDFGTPINTDGVKAYAKFEEVSKTYTVTYLVNGKKVDQEKDVAHNAEIYAPADPVVEGYTFDGWFKEEACTNKFAFANETTPDTITADTTLYAKLTEIGKVNVTYDKGVATSADNMPTGTSVLPNTEYTIPAITPTAEGYTFKGWTIGTGDTVYQPGYTFTVTDNTAITAQWEKIPGKVTVTFDDGDGDPDQLITVPDNVIVDEGSSFVISNFVPERAGYIFKGWNDGTTDYAPGETYTVGATAVTLKAQWADDKVTVTAGAGGTGATLSALTSPVTRGTEVAFTVTVEAGYDPAALVVKANDVALAYSAVNGNVYHYSFVANADTTITVSDLAKLSYTVTMPVGDNFTAKFTDNATSKTVTYGGSYSFIVTPDAGYNIKGVYVNGVKQTPTSTDANTKAETFDIADVTGPQTIEVSVDEIPVYTVTYVVNNAQYTTQKVSSGAKITTLPAAPVVDGYTFNGWATTNGKTEATDADVTADTDVSADMTVYAVLKADTYTVTYNGNGNDGGTVPGAQTKTHGVALNLSTDVPTKTGYKFLGWGTTADATVVSYQPGQTYSADADLALYAVWEQLTFTVTLPSGTGFTVNALDSTTVKYGEDFTFEVIVDRAYAKTAPEVEVNGNPLAGTGATSDSASATWTYKITNITEDKQVAISVTMNPTHVVTFKTWLTDVDPTAANATLYMTQKVENGYPAAQPAAPVVEGYTFGGWVWDHDDDSNTPMETYEFTNLVNNPVTIVAKMLPIVPVVTWTDVTTPEDGWDITGVTAELVDSDTNVDDESNSVVYGSDMTFTVTIGEGWDASKMAVGANGLALAPISIEEQSDKTVVYTYKLVNITADTVITVSGVERKTVTITYNDNARDDVSGMPEQQVVKYYLAGDYDTISTLEPVRTGYEFLGWNTEPNPDPLAVTHAAGAEANFTTDTTLYAIWEAKEVTVELTFSDILGATGEWEKDTVLKETFNLVATFNQPVIGDVTFKKTTIGGEEVTLGTVAINGGKSVTLKDVEAGSFLNVNPPEEEYWVEFAANVDEGYSDATSDKVDLRLNSRALSWSFDANGNKLIIHEGNTVGGTSVDSMTAGQTYTLELPDVVALNAVQYAGDIVAGTQYRVKWQYRETAKSGWVTAQEDGGDTYLVTSEFSGYAFRALVEPLNDPFTKAATYTNNVPTVGNLIDDAYAQYLVTQPTADTVRQETETALEIVGAADEGGDVVINGVNTVFSGIGAHKAQFEGDKVTLKATVVDKSTGEGVPSVGFVNFYLNGAAEPLNDAPVAVGANGVATFEWTTSAYTGSDPTAALDSYTAEYLVNETYEDSASAAALVYIKSTTIQTPVIDEIDDSSTVIGSTTYTADLDGLLAGVKHTFKLRTGNDAADYSVVALDGRTVDANDYTIKWYAEHIVDDNKTGDTDSGAIFVTTQNMMGDKFYVELIAQNNMDVGATSKKAIIGTKQDVKVTVTADPTEQYQLSNVKLTAVVEAAETDATMQPTGTVTFYYTVKDNDPTDNTWTQVGVTTDLAVVAGAVTASIDTTELPVTASTNVKQDLVITAIYSGDDTFKPSAAIDSSKNIAVTDGCTVTNEEVTIYSSVVHVTGIENTTDAGSTKADGIYIRIEGDKILANETNVNLMLSDIYTLDWNDADSSVVENWAKLAFGTDFTVQWQKLSNAAAYSSVYAAADTPWTNIEGATELTCQIAVEDGAAYRAVITTKDTPVAKGSYTEVDQDIDGRRVYYSNILVASDAPATLTVNVNTSSIDDGFEGIVEGETVTIHTFTSGATGTTPISELTMVITDKDGNEVDSQVKTNVNGHVSFDWVAAAPGYYTMKLTAKFTNGYSDKVITRELIVRDNDYSFTVSGDGVAYNGKTQGLTVAVADMGIESALAQNSVVVYYYDQDGKQVEPTQAGTYKAIIRLQESAYWTEKTQETTFTIAKRQLEIEDVIVQAKVYDKETTAYVQEIVLKDAATGSNGLPNVTTGVINGDSVFVTGTAVTTKDGEPNANVAEANKVTVTAGELQGDDAANYELKVKTFSENFKIQRSQVQGDIADATYKYGTTRVPAEDIYLIDQAGTVLGAEDYTVTYYYHSGNGVKQVSAMNWKGMYTVIARPDQDNYKGGASQNVYVADAAVDADPVKTAKSALISITNTVELYGNTKGVSVDVTSGDKTAATVTYNGSSTVPTAAGRYLVKVVSDTGDTAYGIYTIVKVHPTMALKAEGTEYNSAQYDGKPDTTGGVTPDYYTYTGGTIQGIAYEAPTEAGTYVITAHVNETANYTAHETSAVFTITEKALKITADSLQRHQYGAYPDMTASFEGLATGGVAADTSLRDVQIQPELIFAAGYTNNAADQVGNYEVQAAAALARNYTVSYEVGNIAVTAVNPNPELAIHGMIDSSDGEIAYYGDKIQLYAYGSEKNGVITNSSVLDWSVTGPATISADGLLEITGVGTVVVTLKRGIGAQQISTTLTIDACKQEVKVVVPAEDVVYSGAEQTYTTANGYAVNSKLQSVSSDFNYSSTKRTDVGSQIVTGKVIDADTKYQSETYGGLFTINDKEATVAPVGKSVQYSKNLGALTHTEKDSNGNLITDALSNEQIASVRSDYINLDAGTYEILVAGTEDMNYNVKYTTNPAAEVVTVTALENTLKYTTGVIADSTGRTSGYLQAADKFYPDEGAEVDTTKPVAPVTEPNDRMYGEPNPAMNYLFNGLITGDSAADLVELIELVGFVPGIDKEANVSFTDAHISASGVATGKSGTYLTGKTYYSTTTALPVDGVKNYLMTDADFTFGIQNVYQRPFTLKLTGNKTDLRVYKPLVINGSTVNEAKLLEIILDNMEVVEYESGGKKYGGLATKLGHTINDVNLEIVSATYDSVAGTINVELKCNDNYWLSNKNWTIVVDPSMITVSYGTLGKYSSSVTMYGIDENGNNIGATNVSGKVWYEIYVEDTSLERKYSNYKDLTPVVRVQMTKGSGTGVYVANYNSTPLSAGHYVMFAIAEDYTIIE